MTADELLLEVIAAGLTIEVDGDRLLVRPRGQVANELRTAILAQRGEVLAALRAQATMPAILSPVLPRPCTDCERLHAGVFCLRYERTLPEPTRPSRCVRFEQKQPALPWETE